MEDVSLLTNFSLMMRPISGLNFKGKDLDFLG